MWTARAIRKKRDRPYSATHRREGKRKEAKRVRIKSGRWGNMTNDRVSERVRRSVHERFHVKLNKSKTHGMERREKAEQEWRFKY